MKGIFNKQNSFIKDIARKYVLAEFSKFLNKVQGTKKVFSLPADNFIFEKSLIDIYKNIKITGIERNKSVYKNGLKVINNLGLEISYLNQEDRDYFSGTNERFNVIWLDYCGPLTTNLLTSLIPIVQGNHFYNEGILAITLLKGRENKR
jgi:pectate lyase